MDINSIDSILSLMAKDNIPQTEGLLAAQVLVLEKLVTELEKINNAAQIINTTLLYK